MERHRSI